MANNKFRVKKGLEVNTNFDVDPDYLFETGDAVSINDENGDYVKSLVKSGNHSEGGTTTLESAIKVRTNSNPTTLKNLQLNWGGTNTGTTVAYGIDNTNTGYANNSIGIYNYVQNGKTGGLATGGEIYVKSPHTMTGMYINTESLNGSTSGTTVGLSINVTNSLNTKYGLKIVDGNQGLNKILKSDADGNISFTASPTLTSATIGNIKIATDASGKTIAPVSDSTTALQITKANASTPIINVDTTNSRVGIGAVTPTATLEVRDVSTTPIDIYRYANVSINSNDTWTSGAIDKGGCLSLGGVYNSTDGLYGFAAIKGGKTNATPSNISGYLSLYTSLAGTGSVERMRILNTGFVGIGTTAATSTLHVHNTGSDNNYIKITNADTGAAIGDGLDIGITTTEKAVIWNYENTALALATNNSERVTIAANGWVGVNTAPSGMFHIIDTKGSFLFKPTGEYQTLRLASSAIDTGAMNLTVSNNSTANSYLATYNTGETAQMFGTVRAGYGLYAVENGSGMMAGTLSNTPLIIGTNNVERMRIEADGTTSIKYGVKNAVATVTGTTTLDATHNIILCNSASALSLNLPAAASHTNRQYKIKNINSGIVTIDGNASETIDGLTTWVLNNQYESITIVCNGANWFII